MTTVAAVIDRIFRVYLEPPDEQPPTAILDGALSDTTQTLTISSFEVPEDESLMRQGTVLEIGSELLKVTAYSASSVATVRRNVLGTSPAAHADQSYVKMAPPYPRIDVFNALRENCVLLGQKLYKTSTDYMVLTGRGHVAPISELAVGFRGFTPESQPELTVTDGRIVDYHPDAGGRAVVIPGWVGGGYVTYSRRMKAPSSEADTLDDLGIEDVWVTILMVSVAADLLVGRDISKSHTDWISKAIESEQIDVGSRARIAGSLRQYRNALLRDYLEEMDIDHKPVMRFRDPFGVG